MTDSLSDVEGKYAEQLAKDGVWFNNFGKQGKLWFAGRMILHYRPPISVYDYAEIRNACLSAIATAGNEVQYFISRTRGGTKRSKLRRPLNNTRAAQVVYGLLGVYPDLFLGAAADRNRPLLRYTALRRLLAVEAMERINEGAFSYPIAGQKIKVNDATALRWSGITDGEYPFRLNILGRQNVAVAVEKLFTEQVDQPKRSLTYCETAAMAAHLKGLFAADDPGDLGTHLTGQGTDYVELGHVLGPTRKLPGEAGLRNPVYCFLLKSIAPGIDVVAEVTTPWWLKSDPDTPPSRGWQPLLEPDGSEVKFRIVGGAGAETVTVSHIEGTPDGSYTGKIRIAALQNAFPSASQFRDLRLSPDRHVVSDARPATALFEFAFEAPERLLVGDGVYVTNHPIYPVLEEGPWSGEHSLIIEAFHGAAGIPGLFVGGHGLPAIWVDGMIEQMLSKLEKGLHAARKGLEGMLARTLTIDDYVDIDLDAEATVETRTGQPFSGKIAKLQIGADNQDVYVLHRQGESVDARSLVFVVYNQRELMLQRAGPGVPADIKQEYEICYWDRTRGRLTGYPLYWRASDCADRRGTHRPGDPRLPVYQEIPNFGLRSGLPVDEEKTLVIRPRVDGSTSYRQFLKSIGAIPE